MSVRLKVFISSGMQELREERHAVQQALRTLEVEPWLFEDDAGAQSIEGREVYLRQLRDSDLYLGIFWRQYGRYTIDEYEHAVAAGNDCLIFEKYVNVEDRDSRLTGFLDRIGHVESGRHTIRRFTTLEELAAEARKAIASWQTTRIREQRRRDIPEFLAYRCDRNPQITLIQNELTVSAAEQEADNVVCIVHGDRPECHRELIEVLVRHTVPDGQPERGAKPVRPVPVSWPEDARTQEEFTAQLTSRLSNYVFSSAADVDRLAAELDGHHGPVFVHVYVDAADLAPDPVDSIRRFVRFWSEWPRRHAGEALIAFLCIRYPLDRRQGLIQRFRGSREIRQAARVREVLERSSVADTLVADTPHVRLLVARELPDVKAADAELWTDLPDVADLSAGRTTHLRTRIRELYDSPEMINERTRGISMEPLARRLESILREVRA